ncbi:hypothetical protein EDF70_12213 [Neorhizobium sp. JUb45]|nr:hypothetical protein EDF70_12213 [Neorhizobium sp. JUb45]
MVVIRDLRDLELWLVCQIVKLGRQFHEFLGDRTERSWFVILIMHHENLQDSTGAVNASLDFDDFREPIWRTIGNG